MRASSTIRPLPAAAPIERTLRRAGTFAYVARQIDDERASRIEALALPGIHVLTESKRFAPGGDLALSVIGTTDVDNKGIAGLEALLEETLVGVPGSIRNERGPDGRSIAGGQERVTPSIRGNDLVVAHNGRVYVNNYEHGSQSRGIDVLSDTRRAEKPNGNALQVSRRTLAHRSARSSTSLPTSSFRLAGRS